MAAAAAAAARGTCTSQRCSTAPVSPPACSTCSSTLSRTTGNDVFDVDLLGGRLTEATAALVRDERELPPAIGYFGASTGAAAALTAAARLPDLVRAVVSRGGRPDLAADVLPQVRCPTLLVVGGRDEAVLALNRSAAAMMTCPVELEVVHRATHLFEESGALSRVATLACDWFTRHLPDSSDPARGNPR